MRDFPALRCSGHSRWLSAANSFQSGSRLTTSASKVRDFRQSPGCVRHKRRLRILEHVRQPLFRVSRIERQASRSCFQHREQCHRQFQRTSQADANYRLVSNYRASAGIAPVGSSVRSVPYKSAAGHHARPRSRSAFVQPALRPIREYKVPEDIRLQSGSTLRTVPSLSTTTWEERKSSRPDSRRSLPSSFENVQTIRAMVGASKSSVQYTKRPSIPSGSPLHLQFEIALCGAGRAERSHRGKHDIRLLTRIVPGRGGALKGRTS